MGPDLNSAERVGGAPPVRDRRGCCRRPAPRRAVMAEPRKDESLLDLWRAGSEEAARQLFERYTDRLIALARGHIDQRLARRVDPEDITQSAFRTFFRRARG